MDSVVVKKYFGTNTQFKIFCK